jgi:hypothetical protein
MIHAKPTCNACPMLAAFTAQCTNQLKAACPQVFLQKTRLVLAGITPALRLRFRRLTRMPCWRKTRHTPGQTRFAAPVAVDVSMENAGTFGPPSPDGRRLWQCASPLRPAAMGLTLLFDQFSNCRPALKFYAYTEDHQHLLGAYTEPKLFAFRQIPDWCITRRNRLPGMYCSCGSCWRN